MINKNIYELKSKYLYKNIYKYTELLLFCLLSFFLPFFIGHPQILIGSLVNLFLIRVAQYYDYRSMLAIVFFPSLGVYFASLLFGVSTSLLIYFIPLIWISNMLFIYIYKKEMIFKRKNIYIASIKSSITKALFLFIIALLFTIIFNFPSFFLIAMGIIQLTTAIIGSVTSSTIYYLENKKVRI